MASSGMLLRVALVRTHVSEELSASFIRVTRIGELGTTLALTSNRRTLLVTDSVVPSSPNLVSLMKEELLSSEMSVFTRVTRRNIPEGAILQLCPYPHAYKEPRQFKRYYGCLQVLMGFNIGNHEIYRRGATIHVPSFVNIG
jgi:hypothetical protein